MIYRLLIFLLLVAACQRKTVPDVGKVINAQIDTSLILLSGDEIPVNTLKDVNHLLNLGYKKANLQYDSIRFQMYFDAGIKDSIRIQSPGNDTVLLTIGNNKNKTVALYSFLDLLGYRFYGPEDHWTYIPEISSPTILDTTIISYYSLRKLVPSYGAGRYGIKALDTTGFLFNRWMNRLRMANLHTIRAGHYGSTFNNKYKDKIIANPEWRGKNSKGEYRKWSPHLKLCYSNPEVIDLYRKDAQSRLNKVKQNAAPPYFIPLEPPDGDGFCKCATCGSVSDQIYGLANEVAEFLYSKDTNAIVSLYGYNEHAEAPSKPLHKNILVGIVPYAFQNAGSPEKMMTKWENTGVGLYLRDYVALPIWNYDRPTYYPHVPFLNKLDHLRKKGYLGYYFETTASDMATGIKFYLLSKASWQPTDEVREYDNFLNRMFNGHEEEVSLIYENLPELNSSTFSDAIKKIKNLVNNAQVDQDKKVLLRIKDLEFYIEYLYVLQNYRSKGSEQNLNILLDKIMSLPGARLLHPYGLYRVLSAKTKVNQPFQRSENVPVEVKSQNPIQFSLRRRTEKKYEALNPNFYLESVSSFATIPIRNTNALLYVGNNHDGKVMFKARLERKNSSAGGIVTFRDLNNQYITELNLEPDNKWRQLEIKLDPDKFYKVNFSTPGAELFLQGPNRPFAFTEPVHPRYIYKKVPFYFQIPENQDKAIIQIPQKSNEVVVKSGDKILYSGNQDKSYHIDLLGQEGQVIEAIMYRHGVRLVNIPQLIALHPKAVILQNNFEVSQIQSSN